MKRAVFEDVRVEGHLIDSGIMSQVMDDIIAQGGEFESLSFHVGRTNDDVSVSELRVFAEDQEALDRILAEIQAHGAVACQPSDALHMFAPVNGVFPVGFYSTTNMDTDVRIGGTWVRVANPEMDLGIRVDPLEKIAEAIPMAEVREGDLYVIGHEGIRVHPPERPREKQAFEFMASAISSEKPKAQVVSEVARVLRDTRGAGRGVIAVVGPAVVHTGAAPQLVRLVRAGYITVLFGGNAVAAHDIESALYGTSLGVGLRDGIQTAGGHTHHLRAINTVRGCGSIAGAVEQGVVRSGLMHALVETRTPYVLAGSIRDDGPLPDVITDVVEAQREMRAYCQDAGACLMLATMLHSIATGNLLPATTTTVCVDINPAVVTKLADRGSWQTVGIVTDVGLFLQDLADDLGA